MRYLCLAATAAVLSSVLSSSLAAACEPRPVCINIQWCMTGSGHEYNDALIKAAQQGDGNGVGVDTAACQHKYGQKTPQGWDSVSAGCTNSDYAAIGKKALGGTPGSCD